MNYLEWNNAIIKHFFNHENEEKEVMFYFSEVIIEEIGNNNFPKPEEGYIDDFYKALRLGVYGISNDNYIYRILKLEQKYRDSCRRIDNISFEYPPFLTYILAFILPFTSGNLNEDFAMSNFHDYVKDFFEKKHLTTNYDGIIKNHLNEIDELWVKINNWLKNEKNLSLGFLEEINPSSVRKYVGKFEYHILFRKEQEERLSMVFDENDIMPGGALNEIDIRNLLVNNYQQLRISLNTKNRINDPEDYIGRKILNRALYFYKTWDGIIHTVEGQRGYSRNRLVLCLDFNFLSQIINLKYFRIFSVNGIPENLTLEKSGGAILQDKILQINSFYSNPILNSFVDLNTNIELVDNAERIKYCWKSKEFYIFKKISNFDWVEIPKVEFNVDKTLIICKKMFYQNELKFWFENINGGKKIYYNSSLTNLSNDWLVFYVDSITNYPHHKIQELKPDPELKPKINFDRSFYMDGKLFKDKVPIIFLENTDYQDQIIAKYEDGNEIPLVPNIVTEEGIPEIIKGFLFTKEHTSSPNLNKQFKLICGNISINRFLEITDFHKKNNQQIEEILPKRDGIGQINDIDENYIKGLEYFYSLQKARELMPYQDLLDNVFINSRDTINFNINDTYNPANKGNILLNYISTKGQLSKKEFEDCVFSLLDNTNTEITHSKNPAIQLGFLLQDLCYLDYNQDKSIFIINKPHLVIIPTDSGTTFKLIGAIDNSLINDILIFCEANTNINIYFKSDASNILLPQSIYIELRQCKHELILPLVEKFEILFKKSNLFTQFALISSFPDIDNWENFIIETPENEIKDIEGGYIFDIESLKFLHKSDSFNNELSLIKLTNINGYKTIYRLWYNSICYTIPDQQFGIYLFLYLYKKKYDNDYRICESEKGRFGCTSELELKKKAQIKTNILVFDSERKLLAVPLLCRLPKYFSISFQLLSGQSPIIKYCEFEGVKYKGVYLIYQNIPKRFVGNILNIRLLKRDLQNPIFERHILI